MSQNQIQKGPTLREIAMQLEKGEITEQQFTQESEKISQQVAGNIVKVLQAE